jgi:hypothetical protein
VCLAKVVTSKPQAQPNQQQLPPPLPPAGLVPDAQCCPLATATLLCLCLSRVISTTVYEQLSLQAKEESSPGLVYIGSEAMLLQPILHQMLVHAVQQHAEAQQRHEREEQRQQRHELRLQKLASSGWGAGAGYGSRVWKEGVEGPAGAEAAAGSSTAQQASGQEQGFMEVAASAVNDAGKALHVSGRMQHAIVCRSFLPSAGCCLPSGGLQSG